MRNRKNQYYRHGFAGPRFTSTVAPRYRLRPKSLPFFLSPCSPNRINSSTDDWFAAILPLSEDLASFERTDGGNSGSLRFISGFMGGTLIRGGARADRESSSEIANEKEEREDGKRLASGGSHERGAAEREDH